MNNILRVFKHHLVKAFKSTLDEVVYADILLVVSDINDPEVREHLEVTKTVIDELGASDKPIIYVYNKCDLTDGVSYAIAYDNSVCLSAKSGNGIDVLLDMIITEIGKGKRECKLSIPYSEQSALNQLYNLYNVISVEYLDNGIEVKVVLDGKGRGQFAKYVEED